MRTKVERTVDIIISSTLVLISGGCADAGYVWLSFACFATALVWFFMGVLGEPS